LISPSSTLAESRKNAYEIQERLRLRFRTEGKDHFSQENRSSYGGDLSWIIIRGQFHHIKTDDMKGLEFFKKGDESLESEATGFRRPNTREKTGIDHIEIEADIDRLVSEAPHH
jgi:hypothetical protein